MKTQLEIKNFSHNKENRNDRWIRRENIKD